MHNNYYFLRQLSQALKKRLDGFTVVSCFSQNRDELVMEFNDSKTSFFLRANLSSTFCCLSFPENFSRAGKNSIDLFPEIILKKIINIRQYENERSFSIALENDLHLLFKMHGNRANVVLFKKDQVVEIFRHHLKADLEITLDNIDRKIDWSKDYFLAHKDSLKKEYFTFGKPIWKYLDDQGFENLSSDKQWLLLQALFHQLDKLEFFICKYEFKLDLLLFERGEILKKFTDPILAITEFYFTAISTQSFDDEKNTALRSLLSAKSAGESYIKKNYNKLEEIKNDDHYKAWADLIMANLHRISSGQEKIQVQNFYDNDNLLDIPLKQTLSPQKNAEVYYRKSRNQHIEIQKLKESIEAKEKELSIIVGKIELLEKETNLKGLRKKMEDSGIKEKAQEKQPELLPYREVEFKGYKIWIGRNAESNDKLTQKYSYKDDLWLHAKDVAGSHVLLKYQSGKKYPKDVIERAAQLAAYHSKRKNESLCPVAFTFKKFVRKRKGDPAGAVVVEREEVILVEPGN